MVPVPEGYTFRFPERGTEPYPSILAEVAFEMFQLSTVALPSVTAGGLAEKEIMVGRAADGGGAGGRGNDNTMTVVEAEAEEASL